MQIQALRGTRPRQMTCICRRFGAACCLHTRIQGPISTTLEVRTFQCSGLLLHRIHRVPVGLVSRGHLLL